MIFLWTILIAAFVVLDLYAVFAGKLTFSHFVWNLEDQYPRLRFVTPFVLGFIICHFWWGRS